MKKIFLALCVCAGLCACSDDAIDGVGSSSSISLDGNDVYLTVRLNDVNSSTRATSPADDPFTYGSASEQDVSDAYFYFYDENGDFVSRAEVWDGGTASTSTEDPDGNIEFKSNTVIVLKGLTDTYFPRYMVTVLNRPAGFEDGDYSAYYEPAGTLDDFQAKLANATDAIYNTSGNFVMSTSAYNAPTYNNEDVPYYFVTPIEETNFSLEPIDATNTTNPVDVYVERLAAKVEVGSAITADEEVTDEEGTHLLYKLEETIAGTANDDDEPFDGQEGSELEGTDHLYVEFLGWALNGTARNSNIVKDITDLDVDGIETADWSDAQYTFTNWNDAGNFRSYWGKSYNYGDPHTYPVSNSTGNVDADENSSETWLDSYLKYTSLLDVNLHDMGLQNLDPEYCAENTNTPEILLNKRSSGITTALVKAQIWTEDANGNITTGNDIIRFEGMLFTESAFWAYIAQRVADDTNLGLYHWSSNTSTTGGQLNPMTFESGQYTLEELATEGVDTTTWTSLSRDMLMLEDEGNGSLYIELDDVTFDQESTLFWYQSGTNAAGEALYTCVAATAIEGAFEEAREELISLNANEYDINGYASGLMYYAIPIEHLNDNRPSYEEPMPADEVLIAEGNYGVVRNHWYQLSINSLANVGKGIWNEQEVIIPDPTDPISYYIEATLNILSWKMVNQSVSL